MRDGKWWVWRADRRWVTPFLCQHLIHFPSLPLHPSLSTFVPDGVNEVNDKGTRWKVSDLSLSISLVSARRGLRSYRSPFPRDASCHFLYHFWVFRYQSSGVPRNHHTVVCCPCLVHYHYPSETPLRGERRVRDTSIRRTHDGSGALHWRQRRKPVDDRECIVKGSATSLRSEVMEGIWSVAE